MSRFTFSNKKILIISPESWDFIKVSKHHYAQIFASKGNTVYFLNPPDEKTTGISCKKVSQNLFVLDYKDPYKGLRFLPRPLRKFFIKNLYHRLEENANASFDVVILFENSRFYDMDFLPDEVLSIYFQVDEDQNFHPGQAAKSAKVVLAINDIIRNLLSQSGKQVHKIAHGFSGHFSEFALRVLKGEEQYQKPEGRLKAYYVGNLDHNFSDVDLLGKLVRETADVDFVFVGPYDPGGKMYNLIKDCHNVTLLGKVPASTIPKLLDSADVLFFVYREDFLSSSHKVMEYLASGKAIVTTRVMGYPDDKDLFYCSGSADTFVPLFHNVCNHIEEANSPSKMRKRIQFAMDNTYEARVEQIETVISSVSTN